MLSGLKYIEADHIWDWLSCCYEWVLCSLKNLKLFTPAFLLSRMFTLISVPNIIVNKATGIKKFSHIVLKLVCREIYTIWVYEKWIFKKFSGRDSVAEYHKKQKIEDPFKVVDITMMIYLRMCAWYFWGHTCMSSFFILDLLLGPIIFLRAKGSEGTLSVTLGVH